MVKIVLRDRRVPLKITSKKPKGSVKIQELEARVWSKAYRPSIKVDAAVSPKVQEHKTNIEIKSYEPNVVVSNPTTMLTYGTPFVGLDGPIGDNVYDGKVGLYQESEFRMSEEFSKVLIYMRYANDAAIVEDKLSWHLSGRRYSLFKAKDVFSIKVEYSRPFWEYRNVDDKVSWNVFKPMNDVFHIVDFTSLKHIRAYRESIGFDDELTKRILKNVIEDLNFVEWLEFRLQRPISDIFNVSELVSLSSEKPFNETLTVQDVFHKITNFDRKFHDHVDATDDFMGSANVDDDQVMHFQKNIKTNFKVLETLFIVSFFNRYFVENFKFSDEYHKHLSLIKNESVSISELTVKTMTKPFADNAGRFSDSGSVMERNYEVSYVELGYVGRVTNF